MLPDKFGRYEIKSEIGNSSKGVVYLAFDPTIQRQVALRTLPASWSADQETRLKLLSRLKKIASLSHPAIVPIYDFGQRDGSIFIVSRYMPGGSLAARLAKNDFHYQELPRLLQRITSAIEFAQNIGVTHGEIRPSNILFDDDGQAYLADFSFLPPLIDQDAVQAGIPAVDLCYFSPEQIQGQPAGASSDIYSLGVIAFEVLSGFKPFYGSTAAETIHKHLNQPVPKASSFETGQPSHVQLTLEKALAKDPNQRFTSARDFGETLSDAISPKSDAVGAEPEETEAMPEESEGEGVPVFPPRQDDGSLEILDPRNPISPRTEPSRPKPSSRKPQVVNTGFASPEKPGVFLDKYLPLASQASYYFCLGVGEVMQNSIEITPTSLPETLPVGAELQVALFSFPGEIEIEPDASVGLLRVGAGGSATVEKQPGQNQLPANLPWLVFPVKTPAKSGRSHLRCSIYYKQFLVQSRLISVEVRKHPRLLGEQAIKSKLDYNLTKSLSAEHLTGMKQHRLSLMINDNGGGTHGFRFFGEQEFKSDATMDVLQLQDIIELTRKGLRRVAWGNEEPYTPQNNYRFSEKASENEKHFRDDMIILAVRGFRMYDQLVNRLVGGGAQARKLFGMMSESGLVQVALKQDARHVLPVAMFYDYPFNTNADKSEYKICQQFMDALKSSQPLQDCACFHGECEALEDEEEVTICPSGFWGFRHSVGLPLSLAGAPDAPTKIIAKDKLSLVMSVCVDPDFKLRAAHEERLRSLFDKAILNRAADRKSTFKMMQEANAHLVYFYCHGGINKAKFPYIQIGTMEEPGITRDNLRNRVAWEDPRPLVFINGCHTTALEPQSAFELVSGFIDTAGAAGVIGTEITIFEPLAISFAESFLQAFNQGVEIGEAVRLARLALLKKMNPLGLVYIPFAMASLHLEFQN